MFNFTSYCNLKEKNIFNDNSDDEDENFNLGVQAYNPEIFKKLIFNSVTVLSIITELQVSNKNILFGEPFFGKKIQQLNSEGIRTTKDR